MGGGAVDGDVDGGGCGGGGGGVSRDFLGYSLKDVKSE